MWIGLKPMMGVKHCTRSCLNDSLVRASWMTGTGARHTLLACGPDAAPNSLSCAMSCLSLALEIWLCCSADRNVERDICMWEHASPMSCLCTWHTTRWLHAEAGVPAACFLTTAIVLVPHGCGNSMVVFQHLQAHMGIGRARESHSCAWYACCCDELWRGAGGVHCCEHACKL